MSEAGRIPTHIGVEAEVRRLLQEGHGAYISVRGDQKGGLVVQKIADMKGQCRLLAQERDVHGMLVWINALGKDVVPEGDADAYIQRAINRDPDLWIIEIEDKTLGAAVNF